MHRDQEWDGDAAGFGISTAILVGDLLLGWADELFEEGLALLGSREAAQAARTEFFRMRTEVTVGQYLDVLEEHSWRSRPDSEALPARTASSSTSRPSTASRRRSRSAERSPTAPSRSSPPSAISACPWASRSNCATTCSACSEIPA
ncbi:hypothetical protein GCM10025869_32820 [Homoserinibacter gongjuensis]|uniref:Uncharacterized protein n=1 Tax=Homoserinibacter gongjuensis TaxID=1162968 RepID=A0ABQ6JWZ0_9MICO|nr:hypothetical protein GCM10025869_32820 [Homoserinibacter gongjuensis]